MIRRIVIGFVAGVTVLSLAVVGLGAAWLAGVRVPIASGTTYMQIAKLGGADAAGAPTGTFFIALIGSDLRPGVGGARGDALHLIGVNPATNTATMLDVPRDTCWRGDKINRPTRGARGMANALGELTGYRSPRGVRRLRRLHLDRRRCRRRAGQRADEHGRQVPGAHFSAGPQRLSGDNALRYSRDRHDFPNSDITRTNNQGVLILAGMAQLKAEAASPMGEFKTGHCSAATRSSTASASPTSTGSAGWPRSSTRPRSAT